MWSNPHEIADLVTFTKEVLNENFIFSAATYFVYAGFLKNELIIPRSVFL